MCQLLIAPMISHIEGDEIRLPQLFCNFERLAELKSSKGEKRKPTQSSTYTWKSVKHKTKCIHMQIHKLKDLWTYQHIPQN